MKVVLHNYWRSSASHRVRIALGLKRLDYDYVAVNIVKQDQFAEAYRAKNPVAKVPTLEVTEDDGTVATLTQSLPIIEYLDERWPEPPLLPVGSPVLRAHTRALAEIINSGVQPLQNMSVTRVVKQLGGDDQEWARTFIAPGLAAYAQLAASTAGRFSVGDAPTIADCCLIPQLASARRFGVDYAHHELLVRVEQACLALPAFALAMPDEQPDAVRPS